MKYAVIILILGLTTIQLTSCKKEKSFRDKLIGTWYDPNNSIIKFNANNSGTIKISGYQTEDFEWQLQSNNREILISYDPSNSEIWAILALDDSHFNFMQGSNGPINCTH